MVSRETLNRWPLDSFVVVANALPPGRLPTPTIAVLDASEHQVRSATAEIMTSTWLELRDAVARVRGTGSPGSIVVVIPVGGVGRSGHGIVGVLAAGLGALVRTAARELKSEGIAVNGVQLGPSTTADQAVRAISMFEAVQADVVSGQIIRLDDLAPTWPDPTGGSRSASFDVTVHQRDHDPNQKRFVDKVALVTGAVRPPHMGRATAMRLAGEGADVAVLDAPNHGDADADSDATEDGALDRLRDQIEALDRRCHPLEAVIAGQAQADHLIEVVVASLGCLDVVCHFGGGTGPRLGTGQLVDITEQAWNACLDVNLLTPWFIATAAAHHFREARHVGSIVLLSSYAVIDTPERYGAFSASRSVVMALAEQLAREAAADGVRVNTVLPLGVAPQGAPNPGLTDLVTQLGSDTATWAADRIPAGRTQLAAETAAAATFLASDDASFVNGQALPVSGGAADRPLW